MRGKVLLRASEYQWISRVMVLEEETLRFFCPKSQCSLECVQLLDATCETVVVSSDHLHCFRIVEVEHEHNTTKEWIVDVSTSQVKQKWISAIQTSILELKRTNKSIPVVNPETINPSSPAENQDRIDAARRLIRDLQSQRGSLFLRGRDILDMLQKHIGCKTRTEALVLGNTLVNEGYFKHMVSQYTLLDDDCLFETVSRTQMNLQKQFQTMPQSTDPSDESDEAEHEISLQNQTNGYYCPELHNLFVSMLSEIEISYVVEDPRPNEDISMTAMDMDRDAVSYDAAKELKLKECIHGNEAVECLMNAGLLNEDAAVVLGNQLLARGYFSPMDNDTVSFENAAKRYVLSSTITRSIAPTAEETLMEIQCQEEKYRQDLIACDDLKVHGMQLLACSFLVILLLDSLQSMSFGLKILLVTLCVLGKMYFHDPLIVAAAPTQLPTKIMISQPISKPKPNRKFNFETNDTNPNLRQRKGVTSTASTPSSSSWEIIPENTTSAPIPQTLTPEELQRVNQFRTMLNISDENGFLFTDEYLLSVLNVRNRTMTYAAEKLQRCIEWRLNYRASTITIDEVLPQLSNCSFYWHGYDRQNRPIIWTRPKLKNWGKMDTVLEIRAHVFMIEIGIKYLMPPGVTTFTLVTDCKDVGYREVDIRLMKGLMEVCSGNYPDRIGAICIGPLTTLVKTLTRMLSPLLPARLREKAKFMKNPGKELEEFMPLEYIPSYMGGNGQHILSEIQGEFDFNFMLTEQQKRLERLKD